MVWLEQCHGEVQGWIRRHAGVLVVFMSLVGCATSSDIDRLDQVLSQRLDGMAASLRTESSRLNAQVEAQGKRMQESAKAVEGLKASIEGEGKAIRSDVAAIKNENKVRVEQLLGQAEEQTQELMGTRKALEQFASKTQEHLTALDTVAKVAIKEIHSLQQALGSFSSQLANLPAILGDVGNEVHGLNQTLMSSYRLEETALRDRLRAVEMVLKQLELPQAKPAKAAAREDAVKSVKAAPKEEAVKP